MRDPLHPLIGNGNDEQVRDTDWIRPGQITSRKVREPLVDPEVSGLVGKQIKVNDPRLVNLVKKWRSQKDPNEMDNFLRQPSKIKELREVFKHG